MKKDSIYDSICLYIRLQKDLCSEHDCTCKTCPMYEGTDVWKDGSVDSCKFNFEDAYLSEIVDMIQERYGK